LIEDDPKDAKDLTTLLKAEGAARIAGKPYSKLKIRRARNQKEADEAAAPKFQYDIVLLDLEYPLENEPLKDEEPPKLQGMDWLPSLRRLQQDAAIVILTKHADVQYAVRAIRDDHANEFVAKTDKFPNILARIHTAWKNARDIRQAITLRNEYRALLRSLGSRVFAKDMGALISSTKARLLCIAKEIESRDPSAAEEAPDRIRKAARRLSDGFDEEMLLVNDLDERLAEVDLVKEVIEPLEILYENPVDISKLHGRSIRVWTFLNDLRAALREVVQNAIDSKATAVTINVDKISKGAVIHIRDNGGGFSSEALKSMFKARYTSRKGEGAYHQGLGLYIARRMMRSIGGEIRAENENGGAHVMLTVRSLETA
jgi:signal transduction histidine kinase